MTTSSGDFTNFCAEMNENRENTVASGRSSVFARRRVAAVVLIVIAFAIQQTRQSHTVTRSHARTPLEEETPKPLVGLTWFAIPRTRLFARSMSVGRSVAVECEARCNQSSIIKSSPTVWLWVGARYLRVGRITRFSQCLNRARRLEGSTRWSGGAMLNQPRKRDLDPWRRDGSG